jgi:hypothetical protein
MRSIYLDHVFGPEITDRPAYPIPQFKETSGVLSFGSTLHKIRVIQGCIGSLVRLSAPELDVIAEGSNFENAWYDFLDQAKKQKDSCWFIFDVGPTRKSEIAEGLNIDEFEDWS